MSDQVQNEMIAAAGQVAEDTIDNTAIQENQAESIENPTGMECPDSARQEEAPDLEQPKSMDDVITRLQDILEDPTNSPRQELDMLKQSFYRFLKTEQEKSYQDFIQAGGVAGEYSPVPNPVEEQYKKLMNIIREKRAAAQEALEAFRKENYARKLQILDKLKTLIEKANTGAASYNEFRDLLQEWKDIKEIPADKANELWKSFQQYAEQFYDIQKINAEFREYDFKKNLESKIKLCEQAESLANQEDIVSAFHQLQKMHQEYREIGPVAKDLREEIWNRFKAASTIINRRHQQHFDELKQKEQENLEQKTALCEAVESIDCTTLTKYQDWNDKTQEIIALQEKWKSIGRTSQKTNSRIFERFRAACDKFFTGKAEFFKQAKDDMGQNLEKKLKLCEQVEALKGSTEWKATAEKIAELRQEWKNIGPVAKKYSASIWKRFNDACDVFFENRNSTLSSQRTEESSNLKAKKEILEKLSNYDPSTLSETDVEEIQELISEWNSIGHVPFKHKDSIIKEFRRLTDILSSTVNLRDTNRRGGQRRQASETPLEKLSRQYEALKNEIQTYENNLGFLSTSSKSGNKLVNSIQEKINRLKEEAADLLNQIKSLGSEESGE
ncbi:MAG: DUF349 domain-containing protein [Bacteroidaceae bacterium]|nr:DUF349 domain-containing protein [Bacteroidaceae bacterium]